jgi:hypothetical protein
MRDRSWGLHMHTHVGGLGGRETEFEIPNAMGQSMGGLMLGYKNSSRAQRLARERRERRVHS